MWLKKYTSVLNTTLKEVMAYRFDALMSAVFSFLRIWLAYLLWKAIFGSKEMISDYTFPMMLTYYILITFFQRMAKSENMIWETADEVREGTFTKYITRPVNHFTYSLFRSAGKGLFYLTVDSLAFTLWIFLFRENFYFPQDPMAYFYSAGFMILGLFTVMQIHYLTALISFRTVDIAGPWFFVSNFMDFISGSFIPLMLLPSVIREIFSFTPFYYILYYPASLYLEQGWDKMGRALGVIMVWNLILWGFRKIQYRRMIRIYEGVGA
jgi:ABC-2 type transport system permease protein